MASWLDLVPEIRAHKQSSDSAIKVLTDAITEVVNIGTGGGNQEPAIGKAIAAWSNLVNAADRLASLGVALYKDYPDQSRTLVGGTVLELVDNIVDTASAIASIAPQRASAFVTAVSGQPRTLEYAQEVIAKSFPDAVAQYRAKFEAIGLPVSGFPATITATAAPTLDVPAGRIRILHISDLHRTKDEVVQNPELLRDLRSGIRTLNDTGIDCIVVSGDLTQQATSREFEQCLEFLQSCVDEFLGGKKERCIVVPGNHDVDWTVCASKPFRATRGIIPYDGQQRPGTIQLEYGYIQPEQDTLIASKLGFRKFFEDFFGEKFPEDPAKAFVVRRLTDLPVAFVMLDTTLGIHHLSDAAMVHRDALIEAIDSAAGEKNMTIAVGHHGPITQAGQRDALEPWVLERMADGLVSIYLHGHVHATRAFHYTADGVRHLPCVGVGTLVAGPKQRPESTPRHYSVIDLPLIGKTGRVFSRRKETRDGRWQVDKRFGSANDPTDSFIIRWQ
ncbi:MAG TPA: metallophosphoesterase [Polyangium sp.]|nr:metallophosphoesterase [Polyangium sp.]